MPKRVNPPTIDFLLEDAQEIVTLADIDNKPRIDKELQRLGLFEKASIAIHQAKILDFGPSQEIHRKYRAKKKLTLSGKTVLPGFVDAHTHPVFASTREHEFEARIQGKSYQQITAEGGGIVSSLHAVRKASKRELVEKLRTRFDRFLSLGTTTIEAKSGYGLSFDSEIKSLESIREASKNHPLEVISTFLGAHEIAPEFKEKPQEYVKLLITKMLPEVKKKKLAQYCDVFCERGVFELAQTREILTAAKKLGFALRVHAEELSHLGGADLAAELGAHSVDHLVHIDDSGMKAMKRHGVVAVLLPGTSFYLRLSQDAPARRLIEAGVAVALATDFNPGSCYTQSMPAILNLAAVRLRMLPSEAIVAATLNAAFSLGIGDRVGSLHRGKQADLIVCDIPNHKHLAYEFGRNPVEIVIKRGKIVYSRKSSS